ncbi:MAG TPA: hypothetical protein VKY22_29080 [Bradyrhizobium sp.]|nr:hypothetical protein [Bradyrhizobium sp.]
MKWRPSSTVFDVPPEFFESVAAIRPGKEIHALVVLWIFDADEDRPRLVDTTGHDVPFFSNAQLLVSSDAARPANGQDRSLDWRLAPVGPAPIESESPDAAIGHCGQHGLLTANAGLFGLGFSRQALHIEDVDGKRVKRKLL